MMALTDRQSELLAFIRGHIIKHGAAPTFEAMKVAMNLRSRSGIHRLLGGLEERGRIRRLRHRVRAIEVLGHDRGGAELPGPGYLAQCTDADLDRLATDLEVERFARRRDKAIARAGAVMAGEGA